VTEEYLKKFEGCARKLEIPFEEEYVKGEALPEGEIAGELPEELAGKVLALAGRCCAHCGRKLDVHIHHVIFRRNGGTNEILNLICVCRACHQNLHDGSLEVVRDRHGRFFWQSLADRLTALLEDEVKELAAISSAAVAVEAAKEPAASPPPAESADADGESEIPDPDEPVLPAVEEASPEKQPEAAVARREAEEARRVLEELGYKKVEARERVVKALGRLASLGRAPTADEILNTAIRGRAVVYGLTKSASADGGRSGAPGTDPRREPRPPVEGDTGAGQEGVSRIAS